MRLAGLALLFLTCLLMGGEIIAGWKRRLRTVEALRTFVVAIGEQIACFGRPLEEIYGEYRDDCLVPAGFTRALGTLGWHGALDLLPGLDEESRRTAAAFGEALGRGGREQELARCRYTAGQLERIADALRADLPGKTRLCRSLTVMTGAAAVIILL